MTFLVSTRTGAIVLGYLYSDETCFKRDHLFIVSLLYLYPVFYFHAVSLYFYLLPSLAPLLHISLFLHYYNFPSLLTILFVFLIHLLIYGCFELVLSSCTFLTNLIFSLLSFKPSWPLFLYRIDQSFFLASSTPPLTLALI